jgi:undecaprenyl diphosphate synthase
MSEAAADDFDVPLEKRPRHIAIIMDGNGRWAQKRGLPRIEGHRLGAEVLRRVAEECVRLGVRYLTLYCLSSENWKRPPEELRFLMQLLRDYLVAERPTFMKKEIRIRVFGRREGLPDDVLHEMDDTIARSQQHRRLDMCLAINYGGRAELVDAVRSIAADAKSGVLRPEDVSEEEIASRLYTAGIPDPDLLIRTAGEMRVSNFLLWQISYAELWVTERLWPEFDETDLRQAIRDYASRERRFGGLKRSGQS